MKYDVDITYAGEEDDAVAVARRGLAGGKNWFQLKSIL